MIRGNLLDFLRRGRSPRGIALRAAVLAAAFLLGLFLALNLTAQEVSAPPYLYVASQEDQTVSVIDMDARELVATVDLQELGFSPTAKAHHVAVEPDGSHWYVSLIGDGKVLKFNRANRLVGSVDFETPGMLAVDPDSDLLYVARSMAAVNPPERMGMIDRESMEMVEVDVFFPRPHALAIDPVHDHVFVASLGVNRMAWAPLGAEEVDLAEIQGMHHHMVVQFDVSPDGRWMVGTGQMSGALMVFDVSGDEPRQVETMMLGGEPWHPSFTPDGRHLVVPQQALDQVTIYDTSDWSVAGVVTHPAIVQPHGSAVSPDGKTAWVSARNLKGSYGGEARPGTAVAIDLETLEVVKVIEVGRYAAGVGVAAGR